MVTTPNAASAGNGRSLLVRVLGKVRRLGAPREGAAAPPGDWQPLDALQTLGPVTVFAPHPDDESLACGGLIARLRGDRRPVGIVVMSDGSASHPRSLRFPPARLADLRQAEARAAARCLGLDPQSDIDFLALKDGAVPSGPASPGFADAVKLVADTLGRQCTQTAIVPLRHDAHDDHRASFAIIMAAIAAQERPVRVLQYGVWAGGGNVGVPQDGRLASQRHYRLPVALSH